MVGGEVTDVMLNKLADVLRNAAGAGDNGSLRRGRTRGKSLVWEEKIVGAATIVADSRV